MPDPQAVDHIRAYLEQHRHTYDQQALRQRLLADGHDVEAVDLALAQVYGYTAPPGQATPQRGYRAWWAFGATLLLNFLLAPAIAAGIERTWNSGTGLLLYAFTLLAELIAAIALRKRDRSMARGIAFGLLFVLVPVGVVVLLIGICLVAFGLQI